MDPLVLEARAAAEADPTAPEKWIKYGRALRRQSMHREAIAAYCMGISYNPFYPLLYRHRAHAYINIGEFAVSAATFEIALRLDPTNWDCWYHQGVAYYLSRQYERALASFRETLKRSELFDDIVATKDWLWIRCLPRRIAALLPLTAWISMREGVSCRMFSCGISLAFRFFRP